MTEKIRVIVLVYLTVGLNAFSAVILKEAADMEHFSIFLVVVLVMAVILVNLFRVYVWGVIHKSYRLTDSYPLTSLFFPLILLLGVYYGDGVRMPELIGAAMITVGVFILSGGLESSSALSRKNS